MQTQLLTNSIFLLIPLFLLAWFWQIKTKNAGYVDVLWSYCVGLVSIYYFVQGSGDATIRTVSAVITGLWFCRLGTHLLIRVKSEPEDGRYQAMREAMGRHAHLGHLFFFLFQAFLVWLFTLPMWIISHNEHLNFTLLILALLIALVAGIGEASADHQLHRFRSSPNNRGKTCREGWWQYSRHPNYFFEWLHWIVYPILAIGAPFALWVWLTPIVMFLFLYFITGIPFTEQQAIRSRGDDYLHYQQTTNAFFPWRPHRDQSH